MAFPQQRIDKLMVDVHRRCCICHRFCGVKMEIDHIKPLREDGADDVENAIPVCLECHAEIHAYNDKHPRGRKFHSEELTLHKEQWLQVCRDRPDIFSAPPPLTEVGPLQAMIDELEFNEAVSKYDRSGDPGCLFLDEQFRRAVEQGAVALVQVDLKCKILEAYVAIRMANQHIQAVMLHEQNGNAWAEAKNRANKSIDKAADTIKAAREELLKFLGQETPEL